MISEKDFDDLLKRVEALESDMKKPLALTDIPQGRASKLDSDTVDGFQVSPAISVSPNTLVPVGTDGKLPSSVIPANSGWTLVSSQSVTAVSSVTFSGLAADTTYMITWTLVQNTSVGQGTFRFNSDSGANYKFCMLGTRSDSGAVSSSVNGGASSINYSAIASTAIGEPESVTIIFRTKPGDGTVVSGHTSYSHFGSVYDSGCGGFRYDGASTLSSWTLTPSAGTYTGFIALLKITT